MQVPIYQVDAFASRVFAGNPAAVCPLESWLDDAVMQAIAMENNLAETAFFMHENGIFRIRWFTPELEIDLCGHATLASAYVLMNFLQPEIREVRFASRGGDLRVMREGDLYTLDFPSRPAKPVPPMPALAQALGKIPVELLAARDHLAVFDTEEEVRGLRPDFTALGGIGDVFAVIATAPGREADFISRFFAPNAGVAEDPVTGSAHCTLIPYWAARLGKSKLHAFQVSKRGGELWCQDQGDRVLIAGKAALYLRGAIEIP